MTRDKQERLYGTALTEREVEILGYVAQGKENQDIAEIIGLSALTVKNHVQKIMFRLGASNRENAVWQAMERGIIAPPSRVPSVDFFLLLALLTQQRIPLHDDPDEDVSTLDGVEIYDSGRVVINGRDVGLWPMEAKLFAFLGQHIGKSFSRSRILDNVWGEDVFVEERTVDVHILRLRSKLPEDCPYVVETVRGMGYRLVRKELEACAA